MRPAAVHLCVGTSEPPLLYAMRHALLFGGLGKGKWGERYQCGR